MSFQAMTPHDLEKMLRVASIDMFERDLEEQYRHLRPKTRRQVEYSIGKTCTRIFQNWLWLAINHCSAPNTVPARSLIRLTLKARDRKVRVPHHIALALDNAIEYRARLHKRCIGRSSSTPAQGEADRSHAFIIDQLKDCRAVFRTMNVAQCRAQKTVAGRGAVTMAMRRPAGIPRGNRYMLLDELSEEED